MPYRRQTHRLQSRCYLGIFVRSEAILWRHEMGEVARNLGYGIVAAFALNWIVVDVSRRQERADVAVAGHDVEGRLRVGHRLLRELCPAVARSTVIVLRVNWSLPNPHVSFPIQRDTISMLGLDLVPQLVLVVSVAFAI